MTKDESEGAFEDVAAAGAAVALTARLKRTARHCRRLSNALQAAQDVDLIVEAAGRENQ